MIARAHRPIWCAALVINPLVMAVVVVAVACAPTETGNPPATPTIDPVDVRYEETGVAETPTLRGLPGSVEPAAGTIDIVNLDGGGTATAGVTAVGGFEAALPGNAEDLYRVQVVSSDGRSAPVDLAIESDRVVVTAAASGGCLDSSAGVWLDLVSATATDIVLTSGCDGPRTIEPVRLLGGDADWMVDGEIEGEFAPGETRTVTVQSRVAAPDRVILIVPVTGAPMLAITLTGPAAR
jgi:hypothetical protein